MACSRTARDYPRHFAATALPLGDPQWQVPGPLIQLVASLLLALESLAAFAPQNREAACA